MPVSELGERLRRERHRRRERQIETAERFQVSQPSYHRWESSENRPTIDQFPAIADFLGCSLEEIYEMVSGGEPTSLDLIRSELADVQRDMAEIRDNLRTLRAAVDALETKPEPPPKPVRRRPPAEPPKPVRKQAKKAR